MKFAYRAFTASGEERRGVVDANGEADALSRLHDEGLVVAEIQPDRGGAGAATRARDRGSSRTWRRSRGNWPCCAPRARLWSSR